MISTGITAIIAFISTNIDDIFILILFFSQVNNSIRRRHIIIGQYLGIGTLTSIGILGALGVSVFPREYIGFLGLIPIFLGIKAAIEQMDESSEEKDLDSTEIKVAEKGNNQQVTNSPVYRTSTFLSGFVNSGVLKVSSVTIANGGDNIGIYIPLFSRANLVEIFVTIAIFAILTALWCFIALQLTEQPIVQRIVIKYEHIFVPIVFIGLGVFILVDSGTVSFLCKKVF